MAYLSLFQIQGNIMQTLTYQNHIGFSPGVMINRAHQKQEDNHDAIRNAIRAWSAVQGKDVVTMLNVNE